MKFKCYALELFRRLVFSCLALLTLAIRTATAGADKGSTARDFEVRNLIPYVDLTIGAVARAPQGRVHGKMSLGPSMPFGVLIVQPQTAPLSTYTGYNRDSKLSGFTNVNCESTYKYGNLLVSPQVGLDSRDPGNGLSTGHDSDKANEVIRVGYYSADLVRYGIRAEVTAGRHSALYRLTYPKTDQACVLIDPSHNPFINAVDNGDPLFTSVNCDPHTGEITGYLDVLGGWQLSGYIRVYFAAALSSPITECGLTQSDGVINPRVTSGAGQGMGCYFKFHTSADQPVFLKLATSFSSVAQAQRHLAGEISGWDFAALENANLQAWNRALSSILINDETASPADLTLFYTCLYRVLQNPKDKTGDCPWGYAGPYYDDFICVWDQFRTQYPLLELIQPRVAGEIVQSFCEVYRHLGYAPDALIGGQIERRQGGDDVDVIMADAYLKGMPGISWPDVYRVLKGHATDSPWGRTPEYKAQDRGWVPYDSIPERRWIYPGVSPLMQKRFSERTASKTLEMAYNDFCVAEVAGGMGLAADSARFYERSRQWIHLWNGGVTSDGYAGFIQPRKFDGSWVYEDPAPPRTESFGEGSSWVYSYFVPHQQAKLIGLMGGNRPFAERLEHFMKNHADMGNEPSFFAPYQFIYASRPDLASHYVRIVDSGFSSADFPGNEDSGTMGALYVFGRLGFFPVAGQDVYLANGPRYRQVVVQLENGRRIVINGHGAAAENEYVQSAAINGVRLDRAWFRHGQIKDGATLDFEMGPSPSDWGQSGGPPASLPDLAPDTTK